MPSASRAHGFKWRAARRGMLGWSLRLDAGLRFAAVERLDAGFRACFVAMSNSAYSGAALPFRGECSDSKVNLHLEDHRHHGRLPLRLLPEELPECAPDVLLQHKRVGDLLGRRLLQ